MVTEKKIRLLVILLVLICLAGCVSTPTPETVPTQQTAPTDESQLDTTESSATENSVTEPTATEMPVTEPTATENSVTEPTTTEPPVTEPPVTEHPATEPPVTEAPATEPVSTEPTQCPHQYQCDRVDATCTEDGYEKYSCTLCGDSYEETLEAKGHDFGAWQTTQTATCTKDGTKTRSCSGCDKQESKTVTASGHQYGEVTVIQEAESCSALGIIRQTCEFCGDSYDSTYQGYHTFGEPYRVTYGGYRVKCEGCGYEITDFYTWREDSYTDCDQSAALYCDTIKLKESVYTGALSTWSEEWLEWHDFILDILSCHGSGDFSLGMEVELENYNNSADEFLLEYEAFLDAFEAFYGWRPVTDGEPEIGEGVVYLYFDSAQMHPIYESGTNALSSSRRKAIVKDLVAFHIHRMGLRDGMQAYNSVGVICDYMYYRLLKYDHTYRYNSDFRGLTSGNTMCQGYSEIFQLFAEYCGITCEIVEGEMMGEAHAWNRVTFSDGTQRYVDVTNLGYDYYILVPWEAMEYSHKLK